MKLDNVRTTLLSQHVDIFACSETWLTEKHNEDIVGISGYSCIRDDRPNRTGGGVAVWIREHIAFRRLSIPRHGDIEALLLNLLSCKILFLVMYVPPLSSANNARDIIEYVTHVLDDALIDLPCNHVILCGDFNRLHVSDLCLGFNLVNIHNKPTYGPAELDYILFSKELSKHYSVSQFTPIDQSKVPHVSLLATPQRQIKNQHNIIRKVYDLRSSNLAFFSFLIQNVDWSFLDDDSTSLDFKCSLFHNIMNEAANISIPVSYVRFTEKDKPWITPLVKDLINKRWIAFRSHDFAKYSHLKRKVRAEIVKAKILWTKQASGRNLWKAVNMLKSNKPRNSIMSLLSTYDSIGAAVEAVNNALASVFLPESISGTKIDTYISKNKWNVDITPMTVYELIKKTPLRKSSRDLPVALYKSACIFIAEPLSKLFSISVEQANIPAAWKVSAVNPIPKTSAPTLNDLRPISLLSYPAKILERIILSSVKNVFLSNYDDFQYGFRPSSSTQCALVALQDYQTSYLDDPKTCGTLVISYDYSKAFDTLSSNLILKRLMDCDFPAKFVQWTFNYLSERKQYVQFGIIKSKEVTVTSGVPQGSVIGPFLYALTTASYKPIVNSCQVIKYADDTTLCFPIYSSSSHNSHIREEHDNLLRWSSNMQLKMNSNKCKAIITMKRNTYLKEDISPVPLVDSLCVLGFYLDSSGSYSTHIDKTIKKASSSLYGIRLVKPCLSPLYLKQLYCATIRSILEYCGPLLLGISESQSLRLERIQRRFHRLMCGEQCTSICLTPLEHRRKAQALKLLLKATNYGHTLNKLLPNVSNRGRFLLPVRRTTRRCKSFILLACEIFNQMFKR